jgi:hypothetical protein
MVKRAKTQALATPVHEINGASRPERAVKKSVTVRRDLHDAILASVGGREYSAFVNDAIILALQAAGVAATVADFERAHGPLTDADMAAARARRTAARAAQR